VRMPTCPLPAADLLQRGQLRAAKLTEAGVDYELTDNACVQIADFEVAGRLVGELSVARLHRVLDRFAQRYCPIITRKRPFILCHPSNPAASVRPIKVVVVDASPVVFVPPEMT